MHRLYLHYVPFENPGNFQRFGLAEPFSVVAGFGPNGLMDVLSFPPGHVVPGGMLGLPYVATLGKAAVTNFEFSGPCPVALVATHSNLAPQFIPVPNDGE